MNRRTKRLIAGAGMIITASLIVIAVVGLMSSPIAGQRDNDAALMADAKPILTALDRYRADHDCYPNADDPPLAKYLPAGIEISRAGQRTQLYTDSPVNGWLYEHSDQNCLAYTLSRKLGWDPRLIYRREGPTGQWVRDPGDGGAEQVLGTGQ
jgi:hypothetical protein